MRTPSGRTPRRRVGEGEAPYIFFYHWGDGPGRPMSDVQNATAQEIAQWEAFAEAIAEGIGSGYAHVVLEPEWDANPTGANSATFKEPLERIIATFRQNAPNAVLVNGPGLWKSDSVYTEFADVAANMDVQGFLLHIVSNDGDCTWRDDGSSYNGGMDLAEALTIVDKIETRADRVKRLFDADRVMLTDLGITRCSWGDSGQKQIFEKLVDALSSLYDDAGLRAVALRNGGPAPEERYLGHNNEGMFDWSGHPAQTEVDRAVSVLQSHLSLLEQDNNEQPDCIPSDGSSYRPVLRIGENVNDWWVEVYADSGPVDALDLMIEGEPPISLPKTDWGSFAESANVPEGTQIRLIARRSSDGASAGTEPFAFQQGSPTVGAGWAADFQLTANNTTGHLEVQVADAIAVEASVDGASFVALTHQGGDAYGADLSAPSGAKVILRAEDSSGAVAYSPMYDWPPP